MRDLVQISSPRALLGRFSTSKLTPKVLTLAKHPLLRLLHILVLHVQNNRIRALRPLILIGPIGHDLLVAAIGIQLLGRDPRRPRGDGARPVRVDDFPVAALVFGETLAHAAPAEVQLLVRIARVDEVRREGGHAQAVVVEGRRAAFHARLDVVFGDGLDVVRRTQRHDGGRRIDTEGWRQRSRGIRKMELALTVTCGAEVRLIYAESREVVGVALRRRQEQAAAFVP